MTRTLSFVILSVLLLCTHALRSFTERDLNHLRRIAVSDAVQVGITPISLFTLSDWDDKTNKKRTGLAQLNLTNSDVTPLTTPDWGVMDVSPKVLASGRHILFLSNRKGGELRPHISYLDGSNVVPLKGFQFPDNLEMDNLIIPPNGNYFLFTSSVFHDCYGNLECTSNRVKLQETRDFQVYDDLYIRHWGEWNDHRVSHIFLQQITYQAETNSYVVSGAPRDLLEGLRTDSPVKPFGGTEQIAISPDGTTIAFTAENQGHDVSWRTDWDICLVKTNAGFKVRCITTERNARTQNPVFSPDGSILYFGAMKKAGSEADRVRIVAHELATGKETVITENWDRSIDAFQFDSTGKNLIIEAAEDGISKVFLYPLATGKPHALIDRGSNHGLLRIRNASDSESKSNTYVLARSSILYPPDLFSLTLDGDKGNLARHTNINNAITKEVELVNGESFYFPCPDPQPDNGGKGCQAWVLKPINYDESKTYPVAHIVHGGPESFFEDGWSYRWNPQLWASRGYFVLMINPHGSLSFGQRFTEEVIQNWGGTPYKTLQTGLDEFLKAYKQADRTRIGYAGASYGGFMAAYTATQTSRYKAIVMHDGVFDILSQGNQSDELFFGEAEFGGTTFDNPQGYNAFSPMRSITKIGKDQNILVIQGGLDFRIIEGQGISMFTALRRMGINARLLYFPHENHWVLQQRNSIVWNREVLGWFDRYVK